MVEYRPLPDSALDEFRAYLSYAFNPTGDRYDPEDDDELPPPARIGERRGLFDGDRLRSVCAHHFLKARVRGGWHTVGGVSAVATPPEYRRQGNVERLLAEVLAEYRDRDVPIAALWAFNEAFYAKYGWAILNRYVSHEGPPEAFAFARTDPSGTFFQPEKSDWETLNDVLLTHGEAYDFTVDRTEAWWHNRVFESWTADPYVYAWEIDDSIEGYLVYTIDETPDGTSALQVWDMAFTSRTARRNLLRFLSHHESQIDTVRLPTPIDSILIDVIDDPGKLSYTVKAGPMVRLVDVETALESITNAPAISVDFVIDVSDPLVDWNDGTFEVEVSDGETTVSESTASPDLVMDVGPLSQLVAGYRTLEDLEEAGEIGVHSRAVRESVSNAFPARSVFLREHF